MALGAVQSRLGNLEGDMEAVHRDIHDIKDDIKALTNISTANASQVTSLTTYMNQQNNKKKDITRWEMLIVSSFLSIIAGIIVGVITVLVN